MWTRYEILLFLMEIEMGSDRSKEIIINRKRNEWLIASRGEDSRVERVCYLCLILIFQRGTSVISLSSCKEENTRQWSNGSCTLDFSGKIYITNEHEYMSEYINGCMTKMLRLKLVDLHVVWNWSVFLDIVSIDYSGYFKIMIN